MYNPLLNFPNELEQAIRELVSAGPVEVRENGKWFAPLFKGQWEVRSEGDRVLLHVWSEERNLVRRVLRMASSSEEGMLLEVERFGRTKPDHVELARTDREKGQRNVSRESFRAHFQQLLAEQFPDEKLDSLTVAADLEHSLSQCYARGVMHDATHTSAIVGVSPVESSATHENVLAAGLLWLERLRSRSKRASVSVLRLFLPSGASRVTMHRLAALASSVRIEMYEFDESRGCFRKVDSGDTGNVETWLVPRREVEALLKRAMQDLAPWRALAPEQIVPSVVPGTRQVALRFRGVEFLSWIDSKIFFGLGDRLTELTRANGDALRLLIHELVTYRDPLARDVRHPLYRAQPERWLETLVQEDITRVDARLDAKHVYPQLPALVAGDRGILDLLSVTRDGRLAVIELKANEDPQVLLQAADYWLRVRWHQQKGDFHRYGYFAGVALQARPPLLFLVAPGLRFHPATDILLKFLNPQIHVTRVGLAENWRRGLRVIFRQ